METCSVKNCNSPSAVKGMCKPHYMKKYRYGSPLVKTSYDLNEIVIMENYAEVILHKNKGIFAAKTKIDVEDVGRVSKIRWMYNGHYAAERAMRDGIKLHRFILGYFGPLHTDHINGDKLDNRKENLRVATAMQNRQNTGKRGNCKHKYKCVEKLTKGSRWRARITVNKKTVNLGTFATEIEAALAYDKAAVKYFGEFARLNFPDIRAKAVRFVEGGEAGFGGHG